ncbi:hypothetical protein ACFLXG_02555 [Chloroflexota bacterium]
MRILIFNANIITGDGETILENHSLAIEGELIDGIINVPYPNYDIADRVLDAKGDFIIPGIINHHAHSVATGPTSAGEAELPLPKSRVQWELNQHLSEGSTTIVNLDGFATMDEVLETRALTTMLVQTMSTHTPLHLEYAKRLNRGGLKEKHWITAEDMIKQGALGIGEVGGLLDISYIPVEVQNKTGIYISLEEAIALWEAITAEPPDEKTASDLMMKRGISLAIEGVKELLDQSGQRVKLAVEACDEAARVAGKLGVPLAMHNNPSTKTQILDYVKDLKGLLIACHSNYIYKPQEAIEVSRVVKKSGGWVDVHTGDFFRARQFFRNHATTLALLDEGLVDLISTDYIGGYWDPILRVLEYAVVQNVIDMPQAIALATGNVTKVIPQIAPNRGQIVEGKIADLVVLNQKRFSEVRTVLIGGKVVVDGGRIVPS